MGVELQHAVVYGYVVDVDENHPPEDGRRDPFRGYPDSDAQEGDFVTLTPNYGSADVLVVGIVEFLLDSVRWEGPQALPLRTLTLPSEAERQALEEQVEEMPVTPHRESAHHITLTYKW